MTYIVSPSSCSADVDGVWLCDPIVSPEKSSGEPSPIETFGDMLPLEKEGEAISLLMSIL
jgi:hypothetical protein